MMMSFETRHCFR